MENRIIVAYQRGQNLIIMEFYNSVMKLNKCDWYWGFDETVKNFRN